MFAFVAVFVLTVLALLIIGLLLVLGVPVPDQLYLLLTTGVGALGGGAFASRRPADPWPGYPSRPPDDPDDTDPSQVDAGADGLPRHLVRTDTGERLHKDAA